MKVGDFIKQIEPYKDFDMEVTLHLKVMEEKLQKRTYKYPHDNYKLELNIDDIGYSDNVVLIGAEIKE